MLKTNNSKKTGSGNENRLNPVLRAIGIVNAHYPAKAMAK